MQKEMLYRLFEYYFAYRLLIQVAQFSMCTVLSVWNIDDTILSEGAEKVWISVKNY